MKILLTAFEPFGGLKTNSALLTMNQLNIKNDNLKIVKQIVPTVFSRAFPTIEKLLDKEKVDYCICLGQAGGREAISIERVAINYVDARIPDNDGNKIIDSKINENGENAYFSSLPLNKIVNALNEEKIVSKISNTAGTYVCNFLFYNLMEYLKAYPETKGGFIHLPFAKEQNQDKFSLPLNQLVKGVETIITTL